MPVLPVRGGNSNDRWLELLQLSARLFQIQSEQKPPYDQPIKTQCPDAFAVRGIGGSLIVALKRALADAGYSRVSLSVEPDNASRRIYERAGFVRVAEDGGAWTMVSELA